MISKQSTQWKHQQVGLTLGEAQWPQVTYCYPKVTYSDPRVTYSDPKVTYSEPKLRPFTDHPLPCCLPFT